MRMNARARDLACRLPMPEIRGCVVLMSRTLNGVGAQYYAHMAHLSSQQRLDVWAVQAFRVCVCLCANVRISDRMRHAHDNYSAPLQSNHIVYTRRLSLCMCACVSAGARTARGHTFILSLIELVRRSVAQAHKPPHKRDLRAHIKILFHTVSEIISFARFIYANALELVLLQICVCIARAKNAQVRRTLTCTYV